MSRIVALVLAVVLSLGVFTGIASASFAGDECACANDEYELSPGGVWIKKGTISAPSNQGGGGIAPVGEVVKKAVDAGDKIEKVGKWVATVASSGIVKKAWDAMTAPNRDLPAGLKRAPRPHYWGWR